jgi:putative nucleotidyltransferase with HDIG domain
MYRLLIVDDEKEIMNSIERSIRLHDIEIEIVKIDNPLKLVDNMDDSKDIVIVDQRMPEISGLELINAINNQFNNTVIVLMSGFNDFSVVVDAINRGHVFKYLVKPWTEDDLVNIINESIEEKNKQIEKSKIIEEYFSDKEKWISSVHKIDTRAYDALVRVIKVKDRNLFEHSNRVSNICSKIGECMNLDKYFIDEMKKGAILHDIGKIAIHDAIMYKGSKLDDDEFEQVKKHPQKGYEILVELELSPIVLNMVLQHHERIDGKGYPFSLLEDQISLEAKILSVADTFDALLSKRTYKEAFSVSKSLEIIEKDIDTRYDSTVIEYLKKCVVGM